MMTQRRDIHPALDHLEATLEASCATLVALEAARIGARDTARDTLAVLQAQLGDAIQSLRAAIAELRMMHEVETSMLAFGFVLGAPPEWSRAQARRRQARGRHLRPRRTA